MTKEVKEEISLKNTKAEILEALNDALRREKEMKEIKSNPEEEQKKKKIQEAVESTKSNVDNNIFSQELNEKFRKLELSLKEEENRLRELYDVENELCNLTLVVNTHKDFILELDNKKKKAEATHAEELEHLEQEFKKKEEDLRNNYDTLAKNLRVERDRENEEYNYKLKRDRDIANDKWADEKAKREADILARESETKKLLDSARENEQNYIELSKKVESIPKLLEAEYNRGQQEKQKELEREHEYERNLKDAEYKNVIDRQNDKIESLEKELAKITNLNAELQSKLDKAYDQIKELATKTVEANGGVKILGNNSNENK